MCLHSSILFSNKKKATTDIHMNVGGSLKQGWGKEAVKSFLHVCIGWLVGWCWQEACCSGSKTDLMIHRASCVSSPMQPLPMGQCKKSSEHLCMWFGLCYRKQLQIINLAAYVGGWYSCLTPLWRKQRNLSFFDINRSSRVGRRSLQVHCPLECKLMAAQQMNHTVSGITPHL